MILTKELEVSWYYKTKEHYMSKGYVFTKLGDKFLVKLEDLQEMSPFKIELKCDYGNEIFTRRYCDHIKIKNKDLEINKDSCVKCKDLKKRELLEYRQSNGELSKSDNGYWTIKENRLIELKKYIDSNGHANVMHDKKARSLQLSIQRYDGHIMPLLYELGYDNPKKLIDHKLPNYYDDFENLRKEIQNFIDREGHFPNTQELAYDLKIGQRNTGKHGGIFEIRRRMGFDDKSSYMDDRGFFNRSYYEYVVAQYLINNTEIDFKREQSPFPSHEGKYRSDFTFFINNVSYHIEVWGYPISDERHRQKYDKRKKLKIKLYRKYNINLIEINAEIFLNRTLDRIQESLYEIFKKYASLKTQKLNNEVFFNPKMSDKDIFDVLMSYSQDSMTLPKAPKLKKTEGYKFYKEAVRRYGSYQIFAEQFNKNVHHRRNYWDLDKIHEHVLKLIQDGEYVIRPNLRKLGLSCLESAIQTRGDIIQIKLDVYENNLENISNIHPKEIKFLNNVASNQGTNIKGKMTSQQQKQAMQILRKLKPAN